MTDSHHRWRTILADIVAFGGAFGVTNVLSYVYLVVAGRSLLPSQFGAFTALLGVIAISGFLSASLQLAITEAATVDPSRTAFSHMMRRTWRTVVPFVALATLALMPFAGLIGAGMVDALLCGLATLLVLASGTPLAFLAGTGRIRFHAAINLFGTLLRLATGWPLMALGAGIAGGILGYIANYAVVGWTAAWASRRLAAVRSAHDRDGTTPLRLSPSAVISSVLVFAPFVLDQILVQMLAPSLGGDYAAASTVAKLVFYGAYPVIAVAYLHLLRRPTARSRASLALASGAAVACIALILATSLAAFPREITAMFFGDRFQEIAPHVGPLAIGVACFSLSAFGAHVLIAWRARCAFLPSLAALAFGVALFALRHGSLAAVVSNQIWMHALLLTFMSVAVVVTLARSAGRAGASAPDAATGP